MGTHARFSPSTSKKWLNCTMSMVLPEKHKKESSSYATRGTSLHALAEDMLLGNEIQKEYEGYKWSKDDLELTVKPYVEYIENLIKECPDYSGVEEKVFIDEECFGTSDFVGYNKETQVLHVADFKAGQGVFVKAHGNTQLQIYAIGAMNLLALNFERLRVKKVVIHVVQPAIDNIVSVEVKPEDLFKLEKQVKETIVKINKGEGVYHPGEEECRWCPHKVDCPKLNEVANKVAADDFKGVELADKMKLVPALKVFIKAVEDETLSTLDRGKSVPGFKLVRARSSRKWKDENTAIADLSLAGLEVSDIFHDPKFLTVPQMEKVIKSKKIDFDLEDYMEMKQGALKVVTEDNPAKAVDKAAEAAKDFAGK